MPLTGQIGGDEVGGEKFHVEAYLCNTAADSVGSSTTMAARRPRKPHLASYPPQARSRTRSIRRPQNADASLSQAAAVEPAPYGRPVRGPPPARLREGHDRTTDGACIDRESDLVQACALSLRSVRRH